MSATPAKTVSRTAETNTRRLMVRMNGTLFHCLGAAVLLESAAVAAGDADEACRAEREKRVRELTDYASAVWPEFDWQAACRAMAAAFASYERLDRRNPADRAGTRALVARHAAHFYRALARCADDAVLRTRLEDIAVAAGGRDVDGIIDRGYVLGAFKRMQVARAQVRTMRDRTVRRAYELLQQYWSDASPFPVMSYGEFLSRAHTAMAPHLHLDWTERLLLRAWLAHRDAGSAATFGRSSENFRTLMPAAAQRGLDMTRCALPQAAALR